MPVAYTDTNSDSDSDFDIGNELVIIVDGLTNDELDFEVSDLCSNESNDEQSLPPPTKHDSQDIWLDRLIDFAAIAYLKHLSGMLHYNIDATSEELIAYYNALNDLEVAEDNFRQLYLQYYQLFVEDCELTKKEIKQEAREVLEAYQDNADLDGFKTYIRSTLENKFAIKLDNILPQAESCVTVESETPTAELKYSMSENRFSFHSKPDSMTGYKRQNPEPDHLVKRRKSFESIQNVGSYTR